MSSNEKSPFDIGSFEIGTMARWLHLRHAPLNFTLHLLFQLRGQLGRRDYSLNIVSTASRSQNRLVFAWPKTLTPRAVKLDGRCGGGATEGLVMSRYWEPIARYGNCASVQGKSCCLYRMIPRRYCKYTEATFAEHIQGGCICFLCHTSFEQAKRRWRHIVILILLHHCSLLDSLPVDIPAV